MKTDNGCLQHLDALTEKSPLTPEALAHVKVCPACRQLAETLAALRQETTAWPTHDLSGLRQRVVARVRLETLPQSAAEPSRGERQPGPPPSVSWLDLLFAGRTVGYAAVFVCLMVVSALWLHPWQSKPLQTMSAQEFRLVRANGVTETRLVNEKIELASETADLHLPDGSVLAV
ncbi:MAG TPA: hypothetical protein PKO06_04765, partial [Candidatus Ozemobacteraceae bacterium]|nr:hypothetical protein [Candidatus Ozemobacteraceae bacterium]